jgi:predicted aspartyl protease
MSRDPYRRRAHSWPVARALLLLATLTLLAAVDPPTVPTPAADAAVPPTSGATPPATPLPPGVPLPQFHENATGAGKAASEVPEIVVEAPEPRYVAPTRRDKIGRIWAPVLINDKGPFRLVLDTGASHSAINADVARALGVPPLEGNQIMLRGVTGTKVVPWIPVDSMIFGDLEVRPKRLPIITDALGGAEGVLGAEGLADKRILIDFLHDRISIKKSHGERPDWGMVTVPFRIVGGLLTVVDARIGDVRVNAIIDTGGQATIGNVPLQTALLQMYRNGAGKSEEITGATLDVQSGNRIRAPPIVLGGLTLSEVRVTIGDLYIFQYWHMTTDPTILVGMDVLGLLDTLIIDYRRRELEIRLR